MTIIVFPVAIITSLSLVATQFMIDAGADKLWHQVYTYAINCFTADVDLSWLDKNKT